MIAGIFTNVFKAFFEGSAWSSFQHAGFSLVAACGGFSVVAALGHLLLQNMSSRACRLSSCGTQALERRLGSCGARA